MTFETSIDIETFDDCANADPVFAALRQEREAFQAYSDALTSLAGIGAFSCEIPGKEVLDLQLERLADFEVAEATASTDLTEAEQKLLTTTPTSIRGAAALLGFLRKHINEDPNITPLLKALGNIETLLSASESGSLIR